ncbi:3-hydroxylacyl-ACP dehydratase [Halothiobacillus sp. DCM-1]|uniref:3-hydroxylacyl-ACP dehydratase n=1 Tax=Halothiobacillus sp. DCM-1 TaxID=3112558 RepID=UPI0032533B96
MTQTQMTTPHPDTARIPALLPHQGRLCLLDRVLDWDETRIRCAADNHRAPDHPLRWQGQLGSLIGIEYAAQAMALHGALRAPADQPIRQGMITRVQHIQAHIDRLDTLPGALDILATRLMGDDHVVRYGFILSHDGHTLLSGEASVLLSASPSPTSH